MARRSNTIEVYLEVGKKKTFACAVDWPGWTRSGRDEAGALQALLDYGPRYANVMRPARLGFRVPGETSAFAVVERLEGKAVTDFGTPDIIPALDEHALDDAELKRLQRILKACWKAFDQVVAGAQGKSLRTGPRGGGRMLDKIVEHVRGGEAGYCTSLGGKVPSTASPEEARQIVLETLAASARGQIAQVSPRGSKRWPPRYFARRAAWHVLDHVWEIEDRVQ